MELGLGLGCRPRGPNDLDCGRAWLRKAFHRACRWNPNYVRGTAKGDTRVRAKVHLVIAEGTNLHSPSVKHMQGETRREN